MLSENIAVILSTIEATPKCTRVDLANKIFQSKLDSPELPKLKAGLAADLHWLTQAGHVIEFQDGKLDLPLAPKQLENEVAGPEEPVAPVKTEVQVPQTPTLETQASETPTLESKPDQDQNDGPLEG